MSENRFDRWVRLWWGRSAKDSYDWNDVESFDVAVLLAWVDAEAREECAQICDANASIEGIAQHCADEIRATFDPDMIDPDDPAPT